MNDEFEEVSTNVQPEVVLTKVHKEFNDSMSLVLDGVSTVDRMAAESILSPAGKVRIEEVTPKVAAVIYSEHNGKNRVVSYSRVYDYKDAMLRGEWKVHHQGIAVYPDGTLADGQHRTAAVALSGVPQRFLVYPNFDKNAIDTIDRSVRRSAGEALEMMGVPDGKVKAAVAKTSMAYMNEELHLSIKFTDPQVEEHVLHNDSVLDAALKIGINSVENVTEPCLTKKEAQTVAYLMLMGSWPEQQIVGFIASMQQGVATYPESPTVYLSKVFLRAKYAERKMHKLTIKAKYAMALKGAALWVANASVNKVGWNPTKEPLPTHNSPTLSVAA